MISLQLWQNPLGRLALQKVHLSILEMSYIDRELNEKNNILNKSFYNSYLQDFAHLVGDMLLPYELFPV